MQLSMFTSGLPIFLIVPLKDLTTCWLDMDILIAFCVPVFWDYQNKTAYGSLLNPYTSIAIR